MIACLNLQSHTGELSVAEGLRCIFLCLPFLLFIVFLQMQADATQFVIILQIYEGRTVLINLNMKILTIDFSSLDTKYYLDNDSNLLHKSQSYITPNTLI